MNLSRAPGLLLLALLLPALAGCSSGSTTAQSSSPSAPSPSSGPTRVAPVIQRLQGEDSGLSQYENSLVGLRIKFDAAAYLLYEDPAELPKDVSVPGSEALLDFTGSTNRGASMWVAVVPTPSGVTEPTDALRSVGFAMAVQEAASLGPAPDLGPAEVVERRTIGGLPATILERRGFYTYGGSSSTPIRLRSTAVVGRRYTYIFLMEVTPNSFATEFRSFDKLLDGVQISATDAA